MEPEEGLLPIGTAVEIRVCDMVTTGVIDSYNYESEYQEPYIVKYDEESYISCSKYDFSKIASSGTETKFKVGDVVWTGITLYNPVGDYNEYYRKVGLVTEITNSTNGKAWYTLEIDGEPTIRSTEDMHPLFDTPDLDDLSIDYKLVLEQNQELLDSIKDTREWLERMVKLHNAMVRTIVAGERKILDTIKQEEE